MAIDSSPDTSVADFFRALSDFQENRNDSSGNVYQQATLSAKHGFSWSFEASIREGRSGFVVYLNHMNGHSMVCFGPSVTATLGGLLGIPPADELPTLCPDDATPQAASSSSATLEPIAPVVEPIDEELVSDKTETLLSDADRNTAIGLISAMNAKTRERFSINFRHAFNVDRSERFLQPFVTQFKHKVFIEQFVNEAEGIVS